MKSKNQYFYLIGAGLGGSITFITGGGSTTLTGAVGGSTLAGVGFGGSTTFFETSEFRLDPDFFMYSSITS